MPKIAVIGEETQHGPRANCEFIGVANYMLWGSANISGPKRLKVQTKMYPGMLNHVLKHSTHYQSGKTRMKVGC